MRRLLAGVAREVIPHLTELTNQLDHELLLTQIGSYLGKGRLPVAVTGAEFPTALLAACERWWGGLEALLSAIESIGLMDDVMTFAYGEIQRALVPGALTVDERLELRELLEDPPTFALAPSYDAETLRHIPKKSQHDWISVASALDIVMVNGQERPPILTYFGKVVVNNPDWTALSGWYEAALDRRHLRDEAGLRHGPAVAGVLETEVFVMVRVAEEWDPQLEQHMYTLTGWLYKDSETHWKEEGWPATEASELRHRVEEMLGVLLTQVPRLGWSRPTIEFLLPWSKIHEDVEEWSLRKPGQDRGTGRSAAESAISKFAPVVVRSLERLQYPRVVELRNRWRHASDGAVIWLRALQEDPPAEDELYLCDCGNTEELSYKLLYGDPATVCVGVLDWPSCGAAGRAQGNRDNEIDGIFAAFDAGIPMVIWSREDCDTNELRATVLRLRDDRRLHELPDAVRLWRGQGKALGIRRAVTLLYDNPNRGPVAMDELAAPRMAQ